MINVARSAPSSSDEAAALLADIRLAEAQLARGEGIGHDVAEQMILSRLREAAYPSGER